MFYEKPWNLHHSSGIWPVKSPNCRRLYSCFLLLNEKNALQRKSYFLPIIINNTILCTSHEKNNNFAIWKTNWGCNKHRSVSGNDFTIFTLINKRTIHNLEMTFFKVSYVHCVDWHDLDLRLGWQCFQGYVSRTRQKLKRKHGNFTIQMPRCKDKSYHSARDIHTRAKISLNSHHGLE